MITEFHFLRPWWLLSFIVLIVLALLLKKQLPRSQSWSAVCDSHLLPYLMDTTKKFNGFYSALPLFLSAGFMIFSLAGPAWHQLPTPTYKTIEPKVILLSMAPYMLETDLTPNRLSRAKFKIKDILTHTHTGQFALIAYTGEPFVVSPLTEDGLTITALLPSLTPEIIPVDGDQLDSALKEARLLIHDAGYKKGQILVLSAHSPSTMDISMAQKLAQEGINSSILPITSANNVHPLFQDFATAGQGKLIAYTPDSSDLKLWLNSFSNEKQHTLDTEDYIPLWKDEGRCFVILALLCLIPVFQRGWVQRIIG